MRRKALSTRPPMKPTSMPTGSPIATARATEGKATLRLLRLPSTTRLKRSRPWKLVPKG